MTIEECQIAMDQGRIVCVVYSHSKRVAHTGKIVSMGVGDGDGFRGMVGIHVGAGVIYYARPANIHEYPLKETNGEKP